MIDLFALPADQYRRFNAITSQIKMTLGVEEGILQYALCANDAMTMHLLVSGRDLSSGDITQITRAMGAANALVRPRVQDFYAHCCEKTVTFADFYQNVRKSPAFFYLWAQMDEQKLAKIQASYGDNFYKNLDLYEEAFGKEFKQAYEEILTAIHGQ